MQLWGLLPEVKLGWDGKEYPGGGGGGGEGGGAAGTTLPFRTGCCAH